MDKEPFDNLGRIPELDLGVNARFKHKPHNQNGHRLRKLGGEGQKIGQIIIEEPENSKALNGTFGNRENSFKGKPFTKRAKQAIKDYQILFRKALGPGTAQRIIERGNGTNQSKQENPLYNGEEILFRCNSYADAARRVKELVRADTLRAYKHARLGPFTELSGQKFLNGFSTEYEDKVRKIATSMSFRVDYDPKKKNHFNVYVMHSDQTGTYEVNLAFLFPDQLGFDPFRITSLVGLYLKEEDYLPERLFDKQSLGE